MCTLCWAINVPVHLPFLLKAIDLDNILSLYGVHEKYLNNLVSRFDEKLIDNFFRWPEAAYRATLQLPTLCSMLHVYLQTTHHCHWYIPFCSYFKEPWAVAVFHDRFGAFREEVKELLEKKQVRQEGRAPCSLTNGFLHALHWLSWMPCHFFTLQGSDGRSFREEVIQHVSEDQRVSTHPWYSACSSYSQWTYMYVTSRKARLWASLLWRSFDSYPSMVLLRQMMLSYYCGAYGLLTQWMS